MTIVESAPTTVAPEELSLEEINQLLGQRLNEANEANQSVMSEVQHLHDLMTISNGEREKVFQEKIQLQLDGLAKDRLIAGLRAQLEAMTAV